MRLKKPVLFVLMIIFLLSSFPLKAHGDSETIEQLNHMADEILQLVRSSRYEEAEKLLQHFARKFLQEGGMGEYGLSMEEMRVMTIAHEEAAKAVADENRGHQERINAATKFRLVVDAVSFTEEPLWTEMEEPILSVFGSVKEAAYAGKNGDFHSNFNSFLNLYDVIYPSIKLHLKPERIQKLDARIEWIDHYRPLVISDAAHHENLEKLEEELRSIFQNPKEDEADPSLWWVMITTGSIIVITLTYVGWRKYKGQKDREKQKKPM